VEQVLVIHPPGPFSTLLELNLSTSFNINIINRNSAAEGCHMLDLLSDVSLIVTATSCGDERTLDTLLHYLKQSELETKLVVLGENQAKADNILSIIEYSDITQVIKEISNFYVKDDSELLFDESEAYHSYPAKFLLEITRPPCDIYIRVNKGHDVFHYIKRLRSNEDYEVETIQRYLDHGLISFFVLQVDVEILTNEISKKLLEKLEAENKNPQKKLDIIGDSFTFATQLLRELGFKENSTKLVEGVLENIQKTLEEKKFKSKDLMDNLLNSKASIFYRVSHLTSLIGCQMLKESKWGNTDFQVKLAFAAFFHDIMLTKDSMAYCRDQESLNDQEYTKKEIEIVKNHAQKAAKLVTSYPDLPFDADTLILQHHGSLDGIGFTNKLPPSLSKLAYVFIIAEQFAFEVIKSKDDGTNRSPQDILNQIKSEYTSDKALKTIKLLSQSFVN